MGGVVVIDVNHLLAGFVAGLDRSAAGTETGALGICKRSAGSDPGRCGRNVVGKTTNRTTEQRTQISILVIAGHHMFAPNRDATKGLLVAIVKGAISIRTGGEHTQGGLSVQVQHFSMTFGS